MRTVRNSLSRRIALKRPKARDIARLRDEIAELDAAARDPNAEDDERRITLEAELQRQLRRSSLIPYIDPLDVRYKRFEAHPKPVAQAVMFCLMDVSGSMTEHMKDLAKRFYVLLYIFLKRRYKHVDVVFIRHTHLAQEVDEDTFFHSPETGGTVVSTALEEMQRVVAERYSPDMWNIYAAQASDGDNTASDNERTAALLTDGRSCRCCQYFAYLEVGRDSEHFPPGFIRRESDLWQTYTDDLPHRRADGDAQGRPPARHLSGVPRTVRAAKRSRADGAGRWSRRRMSAVTRVDRPLFEGAEWDFATIQRAHDAIEEIAVGELGLDVYPNQIEVISTEQMLDAYSSIGMPLFYKHWSFGKHFARNEALYRAGMQGLAYEIVINSNPCISYIMEENTATMQTLVIAHAAFGHNHFFKNNYVFQQWTDADGILDYLEFAKRYIANCEERYGEAAVERLLDAAHALMGHGVHRYPRKRATDLRMRGEARARPARRTTSRCSTTCGAPCRARERRRRTRPPRNAAAPCCSCRRRTSCISWRRSAPRLAPWQREVLRIVRQIAQYFYPQGQTKVMNEGCATYVHYRIMKRLHENGALTDGAMVEFLRSHTNVVFQPDFDDPRYSGINPYALGFAMMQDIERICTDPTDEDREWFPAIAGTGDAMAVLREVWANYRDESFVAAVPQPAPDPRVRAVPRAG